MLNIESDRTDRHSGPSTIYAPCQICRRVIAMGPVYQGRYVAAHDAVVCNDCWAEDRNGWRTEHFGTGGGTDLKR